MTDKQEKLIYQALDALHIELPSWGFANTGTRFGKFVQAAAAVSTEDKFSDAGQVHALTGTCPTVALHVQWDMPKGVAQAGEIEFFFSSRRRHTSSVSAFLLNRSSDLGGCQS